MRVIFFGTPELAVPSLKSLIQNFEVVAVVTQTDKISGRGQQVVFPPVKQEAVKHGIKVLQYEKIRTQGVEELRSLRPDIMVSCAYGQLFSQEIIDIAPYGIFNIHVSLLPAYRGTSPIQAAIKNGEPETGVTILKTAIGMDDGPIVLQDKIRIDEDDNTATVSDKLAVLGAQAIVKALKLVESGKVTYTEQDDSKATFTKKITKEDGNINFRLSSKEIINSIRAYNPWPVAFTTLAGKLLKIYSACEVQLDSNLKHKPGEVVYADSKNGLIVKVGDGYLSLTSIQPENSRVMPAKDYLNGKKIEVGTVLGK